MPLMGSLATIFGLAVAVPLDSISKRASMNRKTAQMEADRAFWHTDLDIQRETESYVSKNWDNGERTLYPDILIPFFEENPYALYSYQRGMTQKLLINLGIRPISVPSAVFRTRDGKEYNPFMWYEKNCLADERKWMLEHHPDILAEQDKKQREQEMAEQSRIDARVEAGKRRERNFWVYGISFVVGMLMLMAVVDPEAAKYFVLYFLFLGGIGAVITLFKA